MNASPTVEGLLVGYARVSTDDQRLDLQTDALRRAGVLDDNLHVETRSGVSKKRPALDLAFKDLRPGDTLVVWRLDRLGRSLPDLIARVAKLEEIGASFRSLTEAIDTKTASGRLVLHVMGAIAEFERQLIRERTKAGLKALKDRGAVLGAPKKLTDAKIAEAKAMLKKHGQTVPSVAKRLGVSASLLASKLPGGRRALLAKRKPK